MISIRAQAAGSQPKMHHEALEMQVLLAGSHLWPRLSLLAARLFSTPLYVNQNLEAVISQRTCAQGLFMKIISYL